MEHSATQLLSPNVQVDSDKYQVNNNLQQNPFSQQQQQMMMHNTEKPGHHTTSGIYGDGNCSRAEADAADGTDEWTDKKSQGLSSTHQSMNPSSSSSTTTMHPTMSSFHEIQHMDSAQGMDSTALCSERNAKSGGMCDHPQKLSLTARSQQHGKEDQQQLQSLRMNPPIIESNNNMRNSNSSNAPTTEEYSTTTYTASATVSDNPSASLILDHNTAPSDHATTAHFTMNATTTRSPPAPGASPLPIFLNTTSDSLASVPPRSTMDGFPFRPETTGAIEFAVSLKRWLLKEMDQTRNNTSIDLLPSSFVNRTTTTIPTTYEQHHHIRTPVSAPPEASTDHPGVSRPPRANANNNSRAEQTRSPNLIGGHSCFLPQNPQETIQRPTVSEKLEEDQQSTNPFASPVK
jgi:hypothetical protein